MSEKVYCDDCCFFCPSVYDTASCLHPHAKQWGDTYERVRVTWLPAKERNAHNDCPDFTQVRSRWWRSGRYSPIEGWPLLVSVGVFVGMLGGALWLLGFIR
jgi:hypothetical protein